MQNNHMPLFARNKLDDNVGKRLKAMREKRGMSRAMLANSAQLERHTLARLERGAQKPRVETLRALANALNVPLEGLATGWTDDEQRRANHLDHLGRGLRKVRLAAGVTLADAAAAAGVSSSTLSRFERTQTDSQALSLNGSSFRSAALASLLGFDSVDALTEACSDFYGNG